MNDRTHKIRLSPFILSEFHFVLGKSLHQLIYCQSLTGIELQMSAYKQIIHRKVFFDNLDFNMNEY